MPDGTILDPARSAARGSVGNLTGVSGSLLERESTTQDSSGRAHVLFTIATERVQLAAADGARYRLVGAGFDSVRYPSAAVTGAVVREDEQFRFAVLGKHGVAGVVVFDPHTGPDNIPHVRDRSTCQLPNMS